jgi:hypothetical protein
MGSAGKGWRMSNTKLRQLIDAVYVWAGRPTRDGAKTLRALAASLEAELEGTESSYLPDQADVSHNGQNDEIVQNERRESPSYPSTAGGGSENLKVAYLHRANDHYYTEAQYKAELDREPRIAEAYIRFVEDANRETLPTFSVRELMLRNTLEAIRELVDDDFITTETEDGEKEYWINHDSVKHMVDEALDAANVTLTTGCESTKESK